MHETQQVYAYLCVCTFLSKGWETLRLFYLGTIYDTFIYYEQILTLNINNKSMYTRLCNFMNR